MAGGSQVAARLAAGDRHLDAGETQTPHAGRSQRRRTLRRRHAAKRGGGRTCDPLAGGPPAPGRQLELQPSERRLPALLHASRQRGQHHGGHRAGAAAFPRRRLHAQGGRVPGRRPARAGLPEEPRHQDLLRQRPPRRLDVRSRPGHDRPVRGLRHDPRSGAEGSGPGRLWTISIMPRTPTRAAGVTIRASRAIRRSRAGC